MRTFTPHLYHQGLPLQSLRFIGEEKHLHIAPVIPTGIAQLDAALGIGGLPSGRLVEIFGPPGCGKTTLALSIMKNAQHLNHGVCYIDCDHTLYHRHALQIGLKASETPIVNPAPNTCIRNLLMRLLELMTPKLIVVDSSTTNVIFHPEISTSFFATRKCPQQELLQLAHACAQRGTSIIFVLPANDTQPTHMFSQRVLKHYTAIRLALRPNAHTHEHDAEQKTMHIHLLKNPFAATPVTIRTAPICPQTLCQS